MKKYFLLTLLFIGVSIAQSHAQKAEKTIAPVIVIHGGAGFMEPGMLSKEDEQAVKDAIASAIKAGHNLMRKGGSAEEAVVAAIAVLENAPQFNSGKGAVMTKEGAHELDASIMRGSDLQAGAVAGVTTVKNPIKAAMAVMNNSKHVMLGGEGAEIFAKSQELELVENSYFTTDQVKAEWEDTKGEGSISPLARTFEKFGTVGCVALDSHGNIAAGTSTGGLMNKEFGRIGDSPIIGAGTYADNQTCGVSCTGQGEYYIRVGVAKEISDQMAFGGKTLEEAVKFSMGKIDDMEALGGVIALDHEGNIVLEFNTPGMYRGYKKGKETSVEIFGK